MKARAGVTDPVATWSPAMAPSSMTHWHGKLYVGTLQGAAGVIELEVRERRLLFQRRFMHFSTRIRDVRAGLGDQVLWVMTDGPAAELYQIIDLKKSK